MAKETTNDKITVEENANVHKLAGVAEGEILNTTDEKGNPVREKVVYDYNEDDEYVGFHKEVVKEKNK